MPSRTSRARHAAPRDPSGRTALLPGVLLAAAGTAFAGLAAFPASAADIAPRVSAAAALQPVALPSAEPSAPPSPEAQPNVTLGSALAQGLAVANKPKPVPPPAPERASRSRDSSAAGTDSSTSASGATFVRPAVGRVTSSYGRRWGRLHAGVDIAAGTGSPIYAVTSATVDFAGTMSGYGNAIRLVHADGTVSFYAHMASLLVNDGERVEAGEQIGKEGNSGRSTGPHLHFEIRINDTPVDPSSWLRKRGIDI